MHPYAALGKRVIRMRASSTPIENEGENSGSHPTWVSSAFVGREQLLEDFNRQFYQQHEQAAEGVDENGSNFVDHLLTPEDEPPEIFVPRPLKSRKREVDLFGEAGDRSTCWGCVHAGEKDVTISVEAMRQLIEMARNSFGRIDLIALAKAMHDFHESKIRRVFNQNLPPGKKPIPPWPESQILDHLRNHNQDPLVQLVVMLSETQELRMEMLDHCFEVSNKGKVRPNKNSIDSYDKLVKLQIFLQKQDPSKMAFTSHGARVDPNILSQGVISFQGKRLRSHWEKT